MKPYELQQTTGLNAAQQRRRELAARRWVWRIRFVMFATRCSAALALRAVEATDKEMKRW
jgi:hypothetical protein